MLSLWVHTTFEILPSNTDSSFWSSICAPSSNGYRALEYWRVPECQTLDGKSSMYHTGYHHQLDSLFIIHILDHRCYHTAMICALIAEKIHPQILHQLYQVHSLAPPLCNLMVVTRLSWSTLVPPAGTVQKYLVFADALGLGKEVNDIRYQKRGSEE